MSIDKKKLKEAICTVCYGGGGDPPGHCVWGTNELLEALGIDFELEEDLSNYEDMESKIDSDLPQYSQ